MLTFLRVYLNKKNNLNWAASHLADGKDLPRPVQNKTLHRQKGAGARKLYAR